MRLLRRSAMALNGIKGNKHKGRKENRTEKVRGKHCEFYNIALGRCEGSAS